MPCSLQADAGADVKATDPDKTQAHKSAKITLDTKLSIGKRRLKNQPEFTAPVKPDGKRKGSNEGRGIEICDEPLDNEI